MLGKLALVLEARTVLLHGNLFLGSFDVVGSDDVEGDASTMSRTSGCARWRARLVVGSSFTELGGSNIVGEFDFVEKVGSGNRARGPFAETLQAKHGGFHGGLRHFSHLITWYSNGKYIPDAERGLAKTDKNMKQRTFNYTMLINFKWITKMYEL